MINRPYLIALSLLIPSAWGQLHLLAGSPWTQGNVRFPTALLRVGENGTIARVAEVVPHSVGTEWIGVSYDFRKAALLTLGAHQLVVVDFDKAAVVKNCDVPDSSDRSLIYSWLANPPAPGPSFEWQENGADPIKDAVVQGMVLDASVPCAQSFTRLEPEAVRFAVAHGEPGIADQVNGDSVHAGITDAERGTVATFTNRLVPLGYEVPVDLRQGIETHNESMLVNDSHVSVLFALDANTDYRILIFRKGDKTWHLLPHICERKPFIRGFGRYLSVSEVRTKNGQNPRSAGTEKWKASPNHSRPHLRERLIDMESAKVSYPGNLHIYDTETEQVSTIRTNQGDSEVLLIEGCVVYYRVADELYSAVIGTDGIGSRHLIATSDLLLDAHWAFFKR